LNDTRILALDEIGFVWQVNKRTSGPKPQPVRPKSKMSFRPWDEMFSELMEFFKLHGHCNVPIDWHANPELAQWINYQRAAKRQDRLAPDQVQRMSEIGFAWTTNDGDWDAMFAKLAEHLRPAHHGKARNAAATLDLKRWMLTQRQLKKRGELEPERERKLVNLGFEWEPHSKQWEEMYDALCKFHAEKNHCRVQAKWPENPKLASWVATQRARKAEGKLSEDRIAKLDALGFAWRVNAGAGLPSHEAWETMFNQLKQFHANHGHARVPQKYPENRKLAWWVSTQRRNRKNNKLEAEQIARLDALIFDWSPKSGGTPPDNETWQEMLSALESFKAEHGHCRVPVGWTENPKLANWVASQRRHKKTGYLKPERVVALDRIGFEWILGKGSMQASHEKHGISPTAAQIWETRFQELQQYKQAHGNCLVPQRFKENPKLADWVSEQRMAYNRGQLDAERTRRLDELGFDWDPNSTHWEKYYRQLMEFKKEYGHTNVPQRSGKYRELGTWVRNQRAAKRYKRPIMAERAKRLDEIGFMWTLVETVSWKDMFASLVEFKKVHGHCNVPQKSREHKSLEQKRLGKWVNSQRTANTRGKLNPARKQQLDSIGFVWNLRPNLAAAR
jgi:hypothetical protein